MPQTNFIDLLKKIHKEIEIEDTGSRKQFCKKLGISQTTLWKLIYEFKNRGISVKFSRSGQTYYFDIEKHQRVKLIWELEIIDREDF